MNQHITITPCLSAATESTSHQFAFPNSQKNYVIGSQADIRVPMRAIHLADTPEHLGGGKNEPVLVYDTSGAYTDPEVSIDLQQGLPALRAAWIDARGDTEQLDAQSSAYGRERLSNNA